MRHWLFVAGLFFSLISWSSPLDSIGIELKENKKFIKYLVSPGETIYRISTNNKVSITDLMADNPGLENGLKVGQIVLLRNFIRTEPVVKITSQEKPEEIVVQKGETYYGIAKKYGVPLEDLLKWNGVELKEGQTLVLKEPTVKPIQKQTTIITETKSKTIEPVKEEVKKEVIKKDHNTIVGTTMEPETKVSEPVAEKNNTSIQIKESVKTEPKTEVKSSTPEIQKPIDTSVKTTSSKSTLPKPRIGDENIDVYEFDPNRQQVLIVPFDPHLYWSDADDEIMTGSNLKSKLEVRTTIRRRLNALLDPMGFENIQLLGGRFQDTLTDLNRIYTSVTYDYQSAIISEEYKKTLAEQEEANKKAGEVATQKSMKDKLTSLKNKAVETVIPKEQTEEESTTTNSNSDKYFGVIVKDQRFFEYFDKKYSVDYYIFINQFEVITDYDHCLDRTTENYVRKFVVHYSIFDGKGKQIAGNKIIQNYNSNSNNIDKITGDNLQAMADKILREMPLPR